MPQWLHSTAHDSCQPPRIQPSAGHFCGMVNGVGDRSVGGVHCAGAKSYCEDVVGRLLPHFPDDSLQNSAPATSLGLHLTRVAYDVAWFGNPLARLGLF
jgi:hypothetical protein